MKTPRRHIARLLTGLFLLSLLASCSDKGVHMPKHRKRRHCDCPTFALNTPPQPDADITIRAI